MTHAKAGGRGLVAVTGGTGFLGAYILRALKTEGWRVRLLARRAVASAADETVIGTLADTKALERLVAEADVVVHAAGLVKAARPADFFTVNETGCHALAAAIASQRMPPRLIALSSLAARAPHLSAYAASKRAGEAAFEILTDCVVLRPAAVYGPGDQEAVAFFRAAQGPILPIPLAPTARVCMIHAADVATAIARLCTAERITGTFELSDARFEGYTWREVAKELSAAVGRHPRIVELPAAAFRAIAMVLFCKVRMTGRAEMLTLGKVRELFHPDWACAPQQQLPAALWHPVVGLGDGFRETVRAMPTAKQQRI